MGTRWEASAVEVHKASDLPADIGALVDASLSEHFGAVATLRDRWFSGENRFDAPGEALFEAREPSGRLLGICGLNVDPYAGDTWVGRVRHLFVLPAIRHSGVGTALVSRVIDAATGRFTTLRARTGDGEASSFYASLGFRAVDEPDASHEMYLAVPRGKENDSPGPRALMSHGKRPTGSELR
jgi:GNAT superfamily N-acetyltransferase